MKKKISLLFSLLMLPAILNAQDSGIPADVATYIMAGFVLVIAIMVLVVAIVVLQVLRTIVSSEEAKTAEAKGLVPEKKKPFWQRWLTKANDAVPLEQEQEILLDHNYDGIRELDNHLPPWWKWLFYFTIAFSVVYLLAYHVFDSLPLQEEEYKMQVAEAEALKQERLATSPALDINENTVVLVEDEAALASGKQVYDNNCAQCHRNDGGGGIGPNLADEYWLHGGSIQDIFSTIKMGVPEKGMISWEPLLSPEQMQNVASYVVMLGEANPPDAKGPQGEIYREGQEEELVPDSLRTAELGR